VELCNRVLNRLANDVRVRAYAITVDVHNEIVYLSGTGPSHFARVTAGDDARVVRGVRSVVNNIRLSSPMAPASNAIHDRVRCNLEHDGRLDNPGRIRVDVVSRIVSLAGTVPTVRQAGYAVEDAWMVTGVLDVLNHLTVTPPAARTDAALAADVCAALALDSELDRVSVIVSVAQRVVTLRGAVPTCFQVTRAAEDAWSVPGVVEVANELKVARST
jgi:osmotically-inducible protein OsmY